MKCKICHSESSEIFNAKVLKKYDVQYYFCNNCDFIFTEEPYWLDEAYNNPINIADTGILRRNNLLLKHTATILYTMFDKNAKFLDYAGGYGIFVRSMRDLGFDFSWDDLYTQNLLARGFEYKNAENNRIEAITSFETFEHFADPMAEVERMMNISKNIIFTTELMPTIYPNPDEWWYYLFDYGQHINFYSAKTLNYIANKHNLHFYTFGWLHIITEKKIKRRYRQLIDILRKYGLADLALNIILNKVATNMTSKARTDFEFIQRESK